WEEEVGGGTPPPRAPRGLPRHLSPPPPPGARLFLSARPPRPWGACTRGARGGATARALRPLLLDAPELHRRLAEEAGVGDLITRQGVLFVFPSRADFEAEGLSWRLRRESGVLWLELSDDELRQREPALDRHYKFGLLVEENGQCR